MQTCKLSCLTSVSWEFHTTYFDHIQTFPLLSQIHPFLNFLNFISTFPSFLPPSLFSLIHWLPILAVLAMEPVSGVCCTRPGATPPNKAGSFPQKPSTAYCFSVRGGGSHTLLNPRLNWLGWSYSGIVHCAPDLWHSVPSTLLYRISFFLWLSIPSHIHISPLSIYLPIDTSSHLWLLWIYICVTAGIF